MSSPIGPPALVCKRNDQSPHLHHRRTEARPAPTACEEVGARAVTEKSRSTEIARGLPVA